MTQTWLLFVGIKSILWNTSVLIHLCVVYGSVCAATIDLCSCNRGHKACKVRYVCHVALCSEGRSHSLEIPGSRLYSKFSLSSSQVCLCQSTDLGTENFVYFWNIRTMWWRWIFIIIHQQRYYSITKWNNIYVKNPWNLHVILYKPWSFQHTDLSHALQWDSSIYPCIFLDLQARKSQFGHHRLRML